MRDKSETLRRLRLGDLQKLLRWRYGHTLPDDDAGREDIFELLLPISLGSEGARKMENAISVQAPWMSATEAGQLIDRINRTPEYQRKPTARTLGQRLGLLNQERLALGLRTVAPVDLTDEQLQEQRRAKDRARKQRQRRAMGCKTREAYLATSLAKLKLWEAAGISRAAWFRRRETGPSAIKLPIVEDTLVSLENVRARKRLPTEEARQKKGKGKRERAELLARTS